MATRSKGPLTGFEWLQRGCRLAFHHPKPIFGGAVVLVLMCLVPSLVSLSIRHFMPQAGMPPNLTVFVLTMLGSMLIGLLIVPLYAGYLQVIDAIENEQPARIRDIFKPYRENDAPRLIGYGLILALIYIAVLGIIILATKSSISHWYVQALAAQTHHQQKPPLPEGFKTATALWVVFAIFMAGVYPISLGQVALRRCGAINAIGDGCIGTLKNLLPLLMLAIGLVVAWVVVLVVMLIAAILIILLGKLIGAWLTSTLMAVAGLALMLLMFGIMFGVMYHMWHDVCGSGTTPPDPAHAISA